MTLLAKDAVTTLSLFVDGLLGLQGSEAAAIAVQR
jgi:hypothetical protein